MSDIRGETLKRVEDRIRAALELEDTREGHVHRLAREALRALIRDEDGRFDVPTELIALGGAEPGSVQSMFKVTIGGVLHYDASQGVDSPELTDDQLSRLHPARGPGEAREGTRETFIDVTNTNGSGIRVEFGPSEVVGVMNARAQIKLVYIEGDTMGGLSPEQWAFFQTLQEAFTAGQTLTFDFDGKTYTGVRITSLTKEA